MDKKGYLLQIYTKNIMFLNRLLNTAERPLLVNKIENREFYLNRTKNKIYN